MKRAYTLKTNYLEDDMSALRARARAVEYAWLARGHCARARGEEVFVSGALPYRTAARRPIHNYGKPNGSEFAWFSPPCDY